MKILLLLLFFLLTACENIDLYTDDKLRLKITNINPSLYEQDKINRNWIYLNDDYVTDQIELTGFQKINFRDDGTVLFIGTTYIKLLGIRCAHPSFYDNGQLDDCFLLYKAKVAGFTAKKNTRLNFYKSGQIKRITLEKETKISSKSYTGQIVFDENGKVLDDFSIKIGDIAKSHYQVKKTYKSSKIKKIKFNKGWTFKFCYFKKSTEVDFYENGFIKSINGPGSYYFAVPCSYELSNSLEFYDNGQLKGCTVYDSGFFKTYKYLEKEALSFTTDGKLMH